ncbi:uncharacterized protein TNCV_4902111 [Trichonephila clavipes]|nr:uncharacterized protein TNCV_4902111 [Trichonephila clavipes]
MLADKLEAFHNIRRSLPSGPRRYVKASETVNDGRQGRVCADTGSSHLIAGERMFQIFKDKGLLFQETILAMSLADGQQTTGEALTTQKEKLNLLLESFQDVFESGAEATNILEHHINTRNSPPISVPPYRMSPVKNCPDCI